LYDFDDIKGLIESSTAFQLHDVAWGDFEGSEHPLPKLSDDLSRLIVLATKPRTK